MERKERINHTPHRDHREQPRTDQARGVASEVQQTDREAAEDDGEIEPGEKGSFVGEKDFGFDAGGEGDSFAWGGLEEGLGRHLRGWYMYRSICTEIKRRREGIDRLRGDQRGSPLRGGLEDVGPGGETAIAPLSQKILTCC